MQITTNSIVRFREWDPRAGIIGTVEHVNLDAFDQIKSLNVRILRGQEGAWRIVSTFPEHVEEVEESEPVRNEPLSQEEAEEVGVSGSIKEWIESRVPIDWAWLVVIAIAALMIIAAFIAHHPSSEKASEKSEMTRSVEELNQINLKDSEDLGIKRSAEGRIKERKPRKTELLNKINFE